MAELEIIIKGNGDLFSYKDKDEFDENFKLNAIDKMIKKLEEFKKMLYYKRRYKMNKNIILVRDNEDYDYIYGVIILKGNILDISLLQRRLNNMREVLDKAEENGKLENEDYNGEYVLKRVLESHNEYKDLEYISYGNEVLEV